MLNVVSFLFDRNKNNVGCALRDPVGEISYQNLEVQTKKFATWLLNHNVGAHDHIVLVAPDQIATAVAFLAAMYIGAVASIISPRLPKEKIKLLAEYLDPTMTLDENQLGQALEESMALFPCKAYPTSGHDPCAMIRTSGTTGDAKISIHTHLSFFYNAMICHSNYLLESKDKVYYTSKLHSGFGTSLFLASLWAGSENFLDPDLVTHFKVKNNIDRFEPTKFFSTPSIYSDLCAKSDVTSMSKIDRCVVGGERLNNLLLERWQSKTGKKLFNSYGTTELLSGPLANHQGTAALGKVIPGWQVRIVDENNKEVAAGTVGILQVKNYASAFGIGYWKSQHHAQMFGQWFHTNDLVQRDTDEVYHFHGRKGDIVKISGEWINLSSIDQALIEHPSILNACCIVNESDQGVDQIEAVVIPYNSAGNISELKLNLQDYLALTHKKIKLPKKIHVVDKITTTDSGKISRYLTTQQLIQKEKL